MKVYIVTIHTKNLPPAVGACYATLDEAKAEVERLAAANSFTSANVILRNIEVSPPLTPEQARWFGVA